MTAIPHRLLALCLAVFPAASAASLDVPVVPRDLFNRVPTISHGLDWNLFTSPDVSPLTSIEEATFSRPLPAVLDPLPIFSEFEGGDPLNEFFVRLVMALATLIASLGFIPRFHFYRARWKALHFRLPVH